MVDVKIVFRLVIQYFKARLTQWIFAIDNVCKKYHRDVYSLRILLGVRDNVDYMRVVLIELLVVVINYMMHLIM